MLDLVSYWSRQSRNAQGEWTHPDDDACFGTHSHTFNLQFPIGGYVGNIVNASIIILGANAGYRADLTPTEFAGTNSSEEFIFRIKNPAASDWSFVSRYYDHVNYGRLIADGRAVLVNACAYRSPKISEEPSNRKLIEKLPSTSMTRRWLIEAVLPLAAAGKRLVIVKRPGLWKLPISVRSAQGVVFDPAPVSPQLTGDAWSTVGQWLQRK